MNRPQLTIVFRLVLLSCYFCVLISGKGNAQLTRDSQGGQYEYLKPKFDADKADFNQVYFKTENKIISVLWSMTVGGRWLMLNYGYKNNSQATVRIELADMRFNYEGEELSLYQGDWVPYDENDLSKGSFLGLNKLETEECKLSPGDVCVGVIYALIPNNFSDSSKILVKVPINEGEIRNEFIFEKGWMTGEVYRKKFQETGSRTPYFKQ